MPLFIRQFSWHLQALVYQGYAIIGQAKNKLQAFAGFIVGIAGIFAACFGLWNAFPSNPNAGILPASTGDSSSVSTNSGGSVSDSSGGL